MSTSEKFSLLLNFGLPILLLIIAYMTGTYLEKRHFRSIRKRESDAQGFPVVSFDTMPADWRAAESQLVAGSVVVSLDYFKRIIAGLRAIVGGRVKTYEPLLDRARREAMLRMIESARRDGYDGIFNVRLETSSSGQWYPQRQRYLGCRNAGVRNGGPLCQPLRKRAAQQSRLMRFEPRQPDDTVNVSKTHPLVEAGTLVVGLSAIFALIAVALIFLIEIALYFVPEEQEAAMFRDWLPEDLVTVSPQNEQLNASQNLLDRLARHWPDAPYEFRLEVNDSTASNAMAFPGGLIVVTQGLLDQVESENELAFVLAHELGHYRNRDHIRALGRGLVLTLFFVAVTGGDTGAVGMTVADVTLRSFSRRQESRADEFALLLVQSQYGHVNEAWRLFERWSEGEQDSALDFVGYLSTPSCHNRQSRALASAGRRQPLADPR